MSTTALDTQDAQDSRKPTGTAGRHAGGQQVTFPRVVHMEWIKLRSLRSTLYTLAITVATGHRLRAAVQQCGRFGRRPGRGRFR